MMTNQLRPRATLGVDRLEDRSTPAQFNTPWADPMHLSLSFAPDGTAGLDAPSSLFATMDGQMPRAAWRLAVLRAVQSWANAAGLNVGLTADSGDRLGVTGPPQGDPRFGDIRVGALPMDGELAAAIPPDATLAGTLAGDIVFNSQETFTPQSLFSVALHEVGHALGLPPSTDPTSVMYNTFNNNSALNAGDVAAIRGLYGARAADTNEGQTGNGTIKSATRIKYHSSFNGSTSLAVFGDVTTATDVDVFYLPVLDTYTGPITVRLQTTGVSLLAPKLTLTDRQGGVLATATGSGTEGDTLTLTWPKAVAGAKYYLRVEAAAGATFAVGRYGLGVTFDGLVQPTPLSLDAVLRGPYDAIASQDLVTIFKNPNGTAFNDDGGTNDTAVFATRLTTAPGFAASSRYKATASVATATDVDFYRVRAPSTADNAPVVLTATVRAVAPNGAVQRVEVYDRNLSRMNATIVSNGNGTFTVQATGLPANADYYLWVGSGAVGNYQLDVGFGSRAVVAQTFSTGTVNAGTPVGTTLYIGQSQMFGFGLTASGPAGATVQMTITDDAGQVVFTLTGTAGDTVTGVTGLLKPGHYRVRMTVAGGTGPVAFAITGSNITDPIGPQPGNSSGTPQYQDPNNPGGFLYPGNISTTDPYLWLLWGLI
jgi:predicted Zn-dependent protease